MIHDSLQHYHQFTAAVKIQNLYLSYFPDSFLVFQTREEQEGVCSLKPVANLVPRAKVASR